MNYSAYHFIDMPKVSPLRTETEKQNEPVNIGDHAMDNVRFIRDMMERSTSFTAVPGFGGMLMGITAMAAAYIAAQQSSPLNWLIVWLTEAVLAFAIGLLAMWQKSKLGGQSLFSVPAQKFAFGFTPLAGCRRRHHVRALAVRIFRNNGPGLDALLRRCDRDGRSILGPDRADNGLALYRIGSCRVRPTCDAWKLPDGGELWAASYHFWGDHCPPVWRLSAYMKYKTSFLIILSSIVFVAGDTPAQPPAQTFDKAKLDQFFDRLDEKRKAMGSLVIAKDGKVIHTRAIGYSQINATEKKPITTATRFRIGSITKTFTAAMILQLVEEGKLKLTDTLDKYFPQVPNANKITIAHMLSHRSGSRSISGMPEFRALREKGATPLELLTMVEKAGPSDFEPGSKFVYTNENYLLLGLVIEKLTGKTYQENLAKRITSKIGLKDTYAASSNTDAAKNESFSYRYGRDWDQDPDIHWSLFFGAGSIISTPYDLVKFIAALFDGKIISKQSLALMTTMKDDYGFGMGVDKFGDKTYYGHTGGAQSYGAWLAYLPEEKLAARLRHERKALPGKEHHQRHFRHLLEQAVPDTCVRNARDQPRGP